MAQLDSASVFGTEGWGFESLQACFRGFPSVVRKTFFIAYSLISQDLRLFLESLTVGFGNAIYGLFAFIFRILGQGFQRLFSPSV